MSQMYLLLAVSFIIGIIVQAFFCLTLVRTLEQIRPGHQSIKPATIWLLLIPVVSFFWMFIVVTRIAKSIGDELVSRNYAVEEKPGYTIGMVFAVSALVTYIPMPPLILGILAIICFISFIQYWMKINWYRKVLENEGSMEDQS